MAESSLTASLPRKQQRRLPSPFHGRMSFLASDPHVPPLAPPPRITLTVARDRTALASATGGFVNVRRVDLVARFPSGAKSEPFPYDVVDRAAIDAVVVVPHFERDGR